MKCPGKYNVAGAKISRAVLVNVRTLRNGNQIIMRNVFNCRKFALCISLKIKLKWGK